MQPTLGAVVRRFVLMRRPTPEQFAERISVLLEEVGSPFMAGYVDAEELRDAVIDGHFDLVLLAETILKELDHREGADVSQSSDRTQPCGLLPHPT
jgi:hypothetical protein